MGLFSNLTTEGHEETDERVGGGSFTRETDIYTMKIKLAYAGKSDGGAQNVTFIFDDGREFRSTIYVTNRQGQNYFHPKKSNSQERDTSKKQNLPGFDLVNEICLITTDKGLADQATEEKTVMIWNSSDKKELPTSAHVLVDLLGKEISLAIYKQLENKTELQGDTYVDIADTRDTNNIEKVFHPVYHVTVKEAARATKVEGDKMLDDAGNNVGIFWDKWLEAHKGKTKDKRTIKDGDGGQSGRPGGNRSAGAPPSSGNGGAAAGGAPRKSLFGGS